LYSQRANPTSTPAFFPPRHPAAEPEPKLCPIYDPHPEQCEQPDGEREEWKGGGGGGGTGAAAVAGDGVGYGRIVIVVGGGTEVTRCGSAAILRVTVAVEIRVLSLWRAESGGEEIGVIALLPAAYVSRIAAAASTDRARMHVALSVLFIGAMATRQKRNNAHPA